MTYFVDALARAIEQRSTEIPPPRRPDSNNPFRADYIRPERKTKRPYKDPTGDDAVGNISKKEKP